MQLQQQASAKQMGGEDSKENEMVLKPSGTAGTTYSIQVEMGLAGKGKIYDKYKAIQVYTYH